MNYNQVNNLKDVYGIYFLAFFLECEISKIEVQYYEGEYYSTEEFRRLQILYDHYINCSIHDLRSGILSTHSRFSIYSKESLDFFETLISEFSIYRNTVFSNDKLVSFLQNLGLRTYPAYLIKTEGYILRVSVIHSLQNIQEFEAQFLADELNTLITSNNSSNEIKLITQLEYSASIQLVFLPDLILTRAFFNCCCRMAYQYTDFLKEIENIVHELRFLAKNESFRYSSFIGIRSLRLETENELKLTNGITLRQLDSLYNPLVFKRPIGGIYPIGNERLILGCTLEIEHTDKLKELNATTNGNLSLEIPNQMEKILQALKFSIALTELNDKGINAFFFETSFPLQMVGTGSMGDELVHGTVLLNKQQCQDVLYWFTRLIEIDLENIRVPLMRLHNAIFERHRYEDAIVDGIIAWEGMFSEAFETTFKVTASIAKYLYTFKEREEKFKRLKNLYDLRSNLAHGKDEKRFKNENLEEVKREVINIALSCLKKLINDPVLLPLNPNERVKRILVMND